MVEGHSGGAGAPERAWRFSLSPLWPDQAQPDDRARRGKIPDDQRQIEGWRPLGYQRQRFIVGPRCRQREAGRWRPSIRRLRPPLSQDEEKDPPSPLREDWHFPPSLPLFSSRLRSRSRMSRTAWRTHGNSRTICPTRCLVRPYLAPTWAWAAPRATQPAISTLRFQRSRPLPCQRFTARRDCAVVEVSSHHDRFRYRGADRQSRPRTAALGWASTTAATMRARQSRVVLSEDVAGRKAAAKLPRCLTVALRRGDRVNFSCIRHPLCRCRTPCSWLLRRLQKPRPLQWRGFVFLGYSAWT